MRPKTLLYALATADPDGICQSQTPGGAGALTLNGALVSGGVALLGDYQRRVRLTAAADETGHTFTVTGTDDFGRTISEDLAGPAIGTVDTTLNFKTVTSVTIDAAATGAVTVGTTDFGESRPYLVDPSWPNPTSISLAYELRTTGATVDVTVQYSFHPFHGDEDAANDATIEWYNHASLTNKTASAAGSITQPVTAVRLKQNTGTDAGAEHALIVHQAGPI